MAKQTVAAQCSCVQDLCITCLFRLCVCMTVILFRVASLEEHMSDGLQQAQQ